MGDKDKGNTGRLVLKHALFLLVENIGQIHK